MFKKLIKGIIPKMTWTAKKKAIMQILAPRCRRDGVPEYGRFTPKDIERVIVHANSNIKELMHYFKDFDNIGNYLWEYAGLLDLAIYRALITEKIDPNYAIDLIGDMLWQVRLNSKGQIPIFDPLRLKLARMMAKDPMSFLEKRLKDGMKFPYSEPGYKVKLYRDNELYCMDFYSCAVFDFYRQFGQEEITMFKRTWCTLDYAVAEHLVEGGKYKREHTLSDGDQVCDMRWFVDKATKTISEGNSQIGTSIK